MEEAEKGRLSAGSYVYGPENAGLRAEGPAMLGAAD